MSIYKDRFRRLKLKRARSLWELKHAKTVEGTILSRGISIGAVGHISLNIVEKFGGAVGKLTNTTRAANLEST